MARSSISLHLHVFAMGLLFQLSFADGQTRPSSQRNSDETLSIGIAALRQIAARCDFMSLTTKIQHTTKDASGKIIATAKEQIEMTLLNHRFLVHSDSSVNDSSLGVVDVAFDGQMVRTRAQPRTPAGRLEIIISPVNDANSAFMDLYPFWNVLGVWEFQSHTTTADYIDAVSRLTSPHVVDASWSQDRTRINIKTVLGQHTKRICICMSSEPYIETWSSEDSDGAQGSCEVKSFQKKGAYSLPSSIISRTSFNGLTGLVTCDISSFTIYGPTDLDEKKLLQFPETIGTHVVNRAAGYAYTVGPKGPIWEPYLNSLTGRITYGPPTSQPSP